MNSNSLLPYIDYEYLAKHPKIIIGYSDVTALLLGIYARTGLVTFYGLVAAASFGELPPFVDLTWQYFQDICMGNAEIPWEFPMPESSGQTNLFPGTLRTEEKKNIKIR